MPTIVGDLNGLKLMSWVVSIYLLTQAVATPIFGKLADLIGRKPVMLAGMTIFLIGSMLSGLSGSMGMLIFWRAVQGIGAGVLIPVSFTILADLYPVEKRAQVMGFNSTAWGFASMVGPLIGGYLVSQLSWHWVFFINVPVGLLAMVVFSLFLHEDFQKRQARIDWLGSLWLTAFIVTLLMGVEMISDSQWAAMIGFFVVTGLSLVFFIKREQVADEPLINLNMFKSPAFTSANLIAGLAAGFIISVNVYMPTWMQALQGLNATMAGFVVTPGSVVWMFGATIAGRMMAKGGAQNVFKWSLLIGAGYGLFLALTPAQTPYWIFLVTGVVFGLSMGSTVTTTTVTTQQSVPQQDVGMATSFNTLARSIMQSMMTTVYGVVLNVTMAIALAKHPGLTFAQLNRLIDPAKVSDLPKAAIAPLREIMAAGIHNIYWVSVILLVIAWLVNLWAGRQEK
jgi:EmrB/QacA subfamily drug resistance transporter